jgi:hypothetical protein
MCDISLPSVGPAGLAAAVDLGAGRLHLFNCGVVTAEWVRRFALLAPKTHRPRLPRQSAKILPSPPAVHIEWNLKVWRCLSLRAHIFCRRKLSTPDVCRHGEETVMSKSGASGNAGKSGSSGAGASKGATGRASSGARPGAHAGKGPGNAGGWPSTTGKISGGKRSIGEPRS